MRAWSTGSCWVNVVSIWPQVGSRRHHFGLMLAQVGSSWPQVASILPQVGLKLASSWLKLAQDCFKANFGGKLDLLEIQKACKTVLFFSSFIFLWIDFWYILGQLEVNLRPTWAYFEATWGHLNHIASNSKNIEKPMFVFVFAGVRQVQLASEIGLEAVLSQLKPTWSQLEANLRPTWANLRPTWANIRPTWANLKPFRAYS